MPFSDSSQARRVANQRWAKVVDRSEATRPGREAAQATLEDVVDPNRGMSERDRKRAIKNAKAAHMRYISELCVAASRRKRAAVAERIAPETDSAGA